MPPHPVLRPVLRLVSANAASGRDGRTGVVDHAAWAAALARLEPDVVAVQEVDRGLARSGGVDQAAATAAALGAAHGGFVPTVAGTPGTDEARPAGAGHPGPAYGTAVLSRLPLEGWQEHRLAPSRARLPVPLPAGAAGAGGAGGGRRVLWVRDEVRVAVAARVGGVTVVATHLSFSPARAAGQLREVVGWARGLPRPLVLLGDLNLPGRWAARLTRWRPLVRAATFPAHHPRAQLDHALLDDPGDTVHVRGARAVQVGASDHRGLLVDLEVRR